MKDFESRCGIALPNVCFAHCGHQRARYSGAMPLEPLWTGSQLLRELLDDFLSGKLKTETFCRDFEVAYNDAVDESALTAVEQPIFEKLFDMVVWFSPFPDERAEVPNYRSEEQIREAAVATEAQLRESPLPAFRP